MDNREPALLAITVECGSVRRKWTVAGGDYDAMTRAAFDALATVVDDPSVDLASLAGLLALTNDSTGQVWVFPTDIFLQNLARRHGDQTRARAALARVEASTVNNRGTEDG